MSNVSALDLVVRLSDASQRRATVTALARCLGVEDVLLLVRDPVLDVLVPAPGFPQTVAGGQAWRKFLAQCPRQGRAGGDVDVPVDRRRSALALNCDRASMVLLGGEPVMSAVSQAESVFPLVSALLATEHAAVLARAESSAAKEAELRAQVLASALEAARAEASALNTELRNEHERKDLFLAMLGHELRNPLAPLVTTIELLRMGTGDGHAGVPSELLDIMMRQTEQLSRLVDDLLDVSRVSRGRIALRRENVALGEVLRNAVEMSMPLLDARQQRVQFEGVDPDVTVNGDRARLTQIFGNLLNNAAKYSDPGGTITVRQSCREGRAMVSVRDEGIGISREMLPKIFDLFAQAPVALDRAAGGLGIGLTLVRKLVELHGGSVVAESGGAKRGSTFTVALPLAEEDRREPGPAAGGVSTPSSRLDVLIVDDNRDAADSLAMLLRLLGHSVRVAYDGPSAVAMADPQWADLFFLDIGLPGINGHDVLRTLQPGAKPGARFIAVTGYGGPADREASRRSGFDDHLVKPVTASALRRVVDAAICARDGAAIAESRE